MARLTPGMGIVPNACIGPSGWGRSALGARVLARSTAMLSERGFTGWGAGAVSEAELLDEYAWMAALQAQGKAYYSINEVRGESVPDASAEWVVGAFLVGSQPTSALWLGNVQAYGGWSYVHAGLTYGARVGGALASTFAPTACGALLRNFTNGLALVNPRTAPCAVRVGASPSGAFWNLTGGAVDAAELPGVGGTLELAPQSARVLLFEPGSC